MGESAARDPTGYGESCNLTILESSVVLFKIKSTIDRSFVAPSEVSAAIFSSAVEELLVYIPIINSKSRLAEVDCCKATLNIGSRRLA